MSNPTRILLVEDQTLVRDALRQLLNLQTDFTVIADVENGLAAKTIIAQENIDVVLTDIQMPLCDGLELCAWIKASYPTIKTMILTTFNRSGYIKRAIDAGAKAFVLKEVAVNILAEHIRSVVAGKTVFDHELVLAGLSDKNPLSEKECTILLLAEQGLTTAAIANNICLSEGTVRNYLSECMSKLYAGSRTEAARIARDKGWI
jgi:two-component system, NarL family, response regulator DesR